MPTPIPPSTPASYPPERSGRWREPPLTSEHLHRSVLGSTPTTSRCASGRGAIPILCSGRSRRTATISDSQRRSSSLNPGECLPYTRRSLDCSSTPAACWTARSRGRTGRCTTASPGSAWTLSTFPIPPIRRPSPPRFCGRARRTDRGLSFRSVRVAEKMLRQSRLIFR